MGRGVLALVKCRECAKEVSDKARVCPNCGIDNPGTDLSQLKPRSSVPNTSSARQSVPSIGPVPMPNQRMKPKRRMNKFWLVLVIGAGAYFYWQYGNGPNKTDAGSGSTESTSPAVSNSPTTAQPALSSTAAPTQGSSPTDANDEEFLAQAGAWSATSETTNSGGTILCQAATFTPNGSLFEFSINPSNNTQSIIVSNLQWDLKKGDEIPIKLTVNGTDFSFIARITDSQDVEAKIKRTDFSSILSGLPINPSFTLKVSGYPPEQVSLDGASTAIPAMQACAAGS